MSLKKALATLLATVMMLSLVSCGSKSNEEAPGDASKPTESAESSGKIKVGFSSAAFSDEWCHNLALTFENLTATEYPEIEVTVLDGNIDAEKQINTIQSLMQQGMDYIAVQPLPGTEPALQEVVDAGVPLFCVDTVPTSDTLVWTQVGVDEAEFGRLQAEKLAEVLPENGTVCIAMNQLGTNSQINRTRGFEEKIAELRPDVTIIDEQPADSKTDMGILGVVGGGVLDRLVITGLVVGLGVPYHLHRLGLLILHGDNLLFAISRPNTGQPACGPFPYP